MDRFLILGFGSANTFQAVAPEDWTRDHLISPLKKSIRSAAGPDGRRRRCAPSPNPSNRLGRAPCLRPPGRAVMANGNEIVDRSWPESPAPTTAASTLARCRETRPSPAPPTLRFLPGPELPQPLEPVHHHQLLAPGTGLHTGAGLFPLRGCYWQLLAASPGNRYRSPHS